MNTILAFVCRGMALVSVLLAVGYMQHQLFDGPYADAVSGFLATFFWQSANHWERLAASEGIDKPAEAPQD